MPKGEKNRRLSDEQKDEVVRIYTTPAPDGSWVGTTIIARYFNVFPQTISNTLKAKGIKIRTAKEAHSNGKRCKPITNLPSEGQFAPLCACGCGELVEWSQPQNKWLKYVRGHYRKEKPYYNREWLYNEYVNQKRTMGDIAHQFGVHPSIIKKFVRKFNIPTRTQRESLILSGGVSKERNPAWKGGVTPERQRLYKTQEWKDLVKAVYKRDKYHCQRCNTPKIKRIKFHAHHIKSWARYPDLRTDMTNLITLCDTCHTWVHSLNNVSRDFLG